MREYTNRDPSTVNALRKSKKKKENKRLHNATARQTNNNLNKVLRSEVSPQIDHLPCAQTHQHPHGAEGKPLDTLIGALVGIAKTLLTGTQVLHLCDDVLDHLFDTAEVGLDGLELLLNLNAGPVAGVGADLDVELDFAEGVGVGTFMVALLAFVR
jgi:hypothetical protein